MKNLYKILIFTLMLIPAACTEDIVIDIEEGEPLMGVEAYLTDELKQHETILSRTADFYNSDEIEMVSGATVYVTDGVDTIYYLEDLEQRGHYFTEPVAGRKKTLYTLYVDVPDVTEADGYQHYRAESWLPDNAEGIDSVVFLPFQSYLPLPDTMYGLYPFFQSLDDPSINYMIDVARNDTLRTDTLTDKNVVSTAGYAGYYINGEEFLKENMMMPVTLYSTKKLKEGDRYTVWLSSITSEYMSYILEVQFSNGSNPLMGAPSNVSTNIQPAGKAVGWFSAASVISAETVYHEPQKKPLD